MSARGKNDHERATGVPAGFGVAGWMMRLRSVSVTLAVALTTAVAEPPVTRQADVSSAERAEVAKGFLSLLSEPERAWLREHPVIRVAQDPSWAPIEFADAHGTPSGMTSDYLKLIEERLGIKFERVTNLSWQEAYARMKRWEIDMTTTVSVTSERREFWAFTKTYMTMPIVVVTRTDVPYVADLRELAGKKVVVVDGYIASDSIARDYPEIPLVRVKTTAEALTLLEHGEAFACVENMLVVGHYLAQQQKTNLKIAGNTPYLNAQCMAVRKDWGILAGILDKALDSISLSERSAIYRKWMPIQYTYPFDYARLWPIAAMIAVVLLGLLTRNWKLAGEIKRRQHAEESLHRTNRALRMISGCNQALMLAVTEVDLLQAICRLVVELGGFRMAWVGFAEPNDALAFRPVAQAGFEDGYLATVTMMWAEGDQGRGPAGVAIRTGQPVIASDILTDANYGAWREAAIQRGYASSATLPLICGGHTLGALMVYASEPDAFNAEELRLLTELADDLAFGITALRTSVKRKLAEAQLVKLNEDLTRFNRLSEGRELRSIELKQHVNEMAALLGQPRPYPLAFLNASEAQMVPTTAKPSTPESAVGNRQPTNPDE